MVVWLAACLVVCVNGPDSLGHCGQDVFVPDCLVCLFSSQQSLNCICYRI